MKKFWCWLALLCGSALFAAEPLLPPVSEADWKPARNVQAASHFAIEEKDGTNALHVSQDSAEGYSFYRTIVQVKPGDYTLKFDVSGKSEKGMLIQCYSFNADKKPSLIIFHSTIGGVLDPETMHITFKVPADSVQLRFDLGISGNKGDVYYWNPEILPGKVAAPKKKAKSGFAAIPAANGWVAHWLWMENDPGVPAMDFTKEFTLDQKPETAICEITADNGYELVVNGESVGSDVDWKSVETYDLVPFLKQGSNRIVIHARNVDGPAGVLFQAVMMDAAGKATVVATDTTWTITYPDGKPAVLKDCGPVGKTWGQIPFTRINPPKALNVTPLEATREITAGDLLTFKFPLPKELDDEAQKEFPGLQIKYVDVATGDAIALSGIPEFSRCVFGGREKLLWVEHLTSRFAAPGKYRVEIQGKDFVIHAGEITVNPAETPSGCGVHMPKPSLSNTLENADMKQSLYVFSAERSLPEEFVSWAHTGGHFYELGALTGTWSKKMRYDMALVEKKMLQILEVDPLATITVKFRIDVPGWWCAAHPDDVFCTAKGRSGQQSFCSVIWREDAINTVINSMEWLAARPAGKALSGALLMGFRGGEFQLWGEDVGERDCSPVAHKAFKAYQEANHVTPEVSLDDPALDYPWNPTDDPAVAHARDVFFRFVAKRQAENLIYFSNTYKQHFGDRFTFAFYFGYGMEYAGSNKRMLLAGHLGLEDVYAKGTFDMESCPASYGLRPVARSHGFMYPVDSARLHNVLPIIENDVRNCITPAYADGSGVTLHSMRTSILDNRRLRYLAAAHGALVRYLALHSLMNWYDHPAFWRTIREDDQMTMTLQANEIGGPDQLALAVNLMEFTRAWRLPEKQVGRFAGYIRDRLMRTGYGIDFVTLTDFIEQPIRWKQAYVALPGLLTAEQQAALAKKYGKALPAIRPDDGALIWKDGKWSILPGTATDEDIWRALARPEALQAGFDTIWYRGGNFLHTWDGKNLK